MKTKSKSKRHEIVPVSLVLLQAGAIGRKAREKKAAAAAAAVAKPAVVPAEKTPRELPRVDGTELSPEDARAYLDALGLDSSVIDPSLVGPRDREAERRAGQSLNAFEHQAYRTNRKDEAARRSAIEAGKIDAHTAKPEDVEARLRSMGLDPITTIAPRTGAELVAPPRRGDNAPAQHAITAKHDEMVVAELMREQAAGRMTINVMKLTPGELAALHRARGLSSGGWL